VVRRRSHESAKSVNSSTFSRPVAAPPPVNVKWPMSCLRPCAPLRPSTFIKDSEGTRSPKAARRLIGGHARRKGLGQLHTHTSNGPLSGTTRVSRCQKSKISLDFTEARDNEWQWHQLGHMQVCTSLHKDNHFSTPPLSFFTGRMPFLPPNQQPQCTEGKS